MARVSDVAVRRDDMDHDGPRKLIPPESTPGTSSSETVGTAWARWIDERIDLKLRRERKFNRGVLAEVIAQLMAKQNQLAKRSIGKRAVKDSRRAKRRSEA